MALMQDAVTLARSIINDTDSTNYRYADTDLVNYGNQAVLAMAAKYATKLFYATIEITCVQGSVVQRLDGTVSIKLVDILCVVGGPVVTLKDRESLGTADPTWMTTTQGQAQHWIPLGDDPNAFLIYPPPPAGQSLLAVYVPVPPTLAITDTLPFAGAYLPAVAQFIVAMAESRDDIAVQQQRAQMAMAQFMSMFAPDAAPAPVQPSPQQ